MIVSFYQDYAIFYNGKKAKGCGQLHRIQLRTQHKRIALAQLWVDGRIADCFMRYSGVEHLFYSLLLSFLQQFLLTREHNYLFVGTFRPLYIQQKTNRQILEDTVTTTINSDICEIIATFTGILIGIQVGYIALTS